MRGLAALGLALVALQAAAHQPTKEGAAGVLTLDVYARGDVLDLLVAAGDGHEVRLLHRRSADGGATWGAEHRVELGGHAVAAPHRGSDAQIAADGDHLVALWTTTGTSPWGTGPLATSISEDGGLTWRPGPSPADSGSTGGDGYADLLADEEGRFHAVWIDERIDHPGLYAAVSTDGGRTWEANRTVDPTTCSCCSNRLAALGPGAVGVIYRDETPRDLTVASSRDGGASWSRGTAPGGFGWEIEACPMTGGALAVAASGESSVVYALVWSGVDGRSGLRVSRSQDGGRSWGEAAPVADGSGQHGDLACVGGRLGAAWDRSTPKGRQVLGAVSDDGGRTWSAPMPLSAAHADGAQPLVVPAAGAFRAFWTERGAHGEIVWTSARFGS